MIKRLALIVFLSVATSPGWAADGDPSWYQRQSSWEETMRLSREALMAEVAAEDARFAEPEGDFRPVKHPVPFNQTLRVRIPVKGLSTLSISARSPASAILGEPRLIAEDGTATPCMPGTAGQVMRSFPPGWAFEGLGKPITVGDQTLAQGVQMRGGGEEMSIALDGRYAWFEAVLAVTKGKSEGKEGDQHVFAFERRGYFERRTAQTERTTRLWSLVRRDFSTGDLTHDRTISDRGGIWNNDWKAGDLKGLARRYAAQCIGAWKTTADAAAATVATPADLAQLRELYQRSLRSRDLAEDIAMVNIEAARLAVADLGTSFPDRYNAVRHAKALDAFAAGREVALAGLQAGNDQALADAERLVEGVRTALLANPLLDVDKLLVVRRDFGDAEARRVTSGYTYADATGLLDTSFRSQSGMRHRTKFDNQIAVLSNLRSNPRLTPLYRPQEAKFLVRDVRLSYDADKVLFTSPVQRGGRENWAVQELTVADGSVRELTPTDYPDLHFYDACYLPNGKIILGSNASYNGVPCLGGTEKVSSLYLLDPATRTLRRLTFDQDHAYHPTVMRDGRVIFVRWEYSDIPHYFSRRVMVMNPDGTGQVSIYGSNSWFPTSFMFPVAVPDHPTRMFAILSGHHDAGEAGRLALVDHGLSSHYPFRHRPESKEWGEEKSHIIVRPEVQPAEKSGFIQYLPGRGKPVAAAVCDDIVQKVYLKERPELMAHPHPLSGTYVLVSMKPKADGLWGIYLVDTFDNMTRIADIDAAGLFEPIPLRAHPRPPVLPDRVQEGATTASVFISNVYEGPGLKDVPKGNITHMRAVAYHFGYAGRAGPHYVGTESSWDVKRVLGTAAVEADGSASFTIPANTPVLLQPLDAEGRAVQLMRSWLVGMPGERVSCVGCHEGRNHVVPARPSMAARRAPEDLTPWYGPARSFGFAREVHPVLQRYCMDCHDGKSEVGPRSKPSFKSAADAYTGLHPYVHRPGPESDMTLFNPMEYHASTSPLIQLLEKGHHGVKLADLDRESRDRLYTWIDLNAPRSDSYNEGKPIMANGVDSVARRHELDQEFACLDVQPELEGAAVPVKPVIYQAPPAQEPVKPDGLTCTGFPMEATAAARVQQDQGETNRTLSLGKDITMVLRRIPAGSFVMGNQSGAGDEHPRAVVAVGHAFWMAETEVTNAQYEHFDPSHDTRYIDIHGINSVFPGFIANHPRQPVARVSWQEALRFCAWLSGQTGLKATLPTEAQWEWAARAGSDTAFFYGGQDSDWSTQANLADQGLGWFQSGWYGAGIIQSFKPYPAGNNFPLRDERFKDQSRVVDYVGQTRANPWGLKDMVGNVSEWTRSSYQAYPYVDGDGRNDGDPAQRKVARGGSWADRPTDAGSSVRKPYESWQKVYDVGFRVIIEER
jgi:formylglycine-generating enzyme required for sulfatase activity